MSNKTFSSVSTRECEDIYKQILSNSDDLWITGEILAKEGKYGRANSISITSIEELIKSIIFLYDSLGFEFRRVRGINSLLRNHELRYVIAYLLYLVGGLFSEFERVSHKAIENQEEIKKFMEELKKDPNKIFTKTKRYFLKKFVQLKREGVWFHKADLFRQNGFYSDYNGELKNPLTITEEDFRNKIEHLQFVRTMGKSIINHIERKPESVKRFEVECRTNDYYTELGEILHLINTRRKKPFELLEKRLK